MKARAADSEARAADSEAMAAILQKEKCKAALMSEVCPPISAAIKCRPYPYQSVLKSLCNHYCVYNRQFDGQFVKSRGIYV